MKNKRQRLSVISEVLHLQIIGSQEELLAILKGKGYDVTQATLSRDLKALKVAKTPLSNGMYKYILPSNINPELDMFKNKENKPLGAILSMEFSGKLAVVKTKPGYANAIAWDIDNRATYEVLGTIAGDDTILVIPRENVSKEELTKMIYTIFQEK
ncbi:MAG: ArgR family transcriptional regulator [Paludibacteraceae bacterium]